MNALRAALRIFSGKKFLNFGFQESLRTFLKPIFTGRGLGGEQHMLSLAPCGSIRVSMKTCIFQYSLFVKMRFGAARVCAAIKSPMGLLSGERSCVSRWRGFAPTSSAGCDKRE